MDSLIQDAKTLFNVHLTARQAEALVNYERELLAWNQKFNLTAIRDAKSIRAKHFLDSYSCVLAWKANPPQRLVDVGTGAGFPGIPLKIIYPAMHVTLVESVGKKAAFCRHVTQTLRLDAIEVIHARAEELGQDPARRETYDWAVARAVANLNILSEYLLPFVKLGGTMLAQKGESGPAEAQSAEKAMKLLGGKLKRLIPVHLPGVADERWLVLAEKFAATPPRYPRKAGTPMKTPL
ncbi:MAG: 16S rRNA (guanine(527)-N(7))-methyltransferase RsmG [Chloroflexi bacterium]|nr:16S rRNA (guanine(527)-N(7))-methyltransferase RsmG [Chloroflexi bacterium CFX1]MCK6569355.1 16S rRNA (guanine(527)-N(7))-methyltransferase RsmG [Anaerolineales bacterium]MCQ3954079.1 16S rRNA (guanine(527)-N(7))-methyltransferase RsmG [Chloroflexota bacterium]MDL1920022.1 16S rRNA (guanine(527)-N(7))-methyltransferase RsmG [Chloroflexi bacterium CFX5]NUQ59930.1 16S rRNA (guanine(527)-N(7))-methyltransferase RsmG [Anaerolineales bacterium]